MPTKYWQIIRFSCSRLGMLLDKLMIFVKAPRPGQVKTRLADTLGAQAACAAYIRLVDTLLKHVASLPAVELRFAPDEAEREIRPWLRPNWQARPQGNGDLGQRLHRAFDDAFAAGAKRVVVLGSDCPEVEAADVEQAWTELEAHDVVVGPATDGGYWLIGLKQPQPALFADIAWSSEIVLAQTLQRAKTAALRVQLLRILTDVDTEREWREFLASAT
jgi:rSAM/selenodomain-associated transferase 1